jgi:hypothetical protein
MSLESDPGETAKPIQFGSQQFIDYFALRYHREVAEHLRSRPQVVISHARRTLAHWRQVGAPGADADSEWDAILDDYSIEELVALITEDSEEGTRLRTGSPFCGVLSPKRRREILNECEERVS